MNTKNNKSKSDNLLSAFKKYAFPPYKVSPVWAVATALLAFIFILQVVLTVDSVRRYKNQYFDNETLKNEILVNKETIATGMENSNTNYIDSMFKILLTSGKLLTLEQSYWSYEIKVNGAEITNNSITVKPGKLVITFVENEKPRILPLRMHNTGALTGGDTSDPYYTHLFISSAVKYETDIKSEDGKKTTTFTFNDVASGESITLSPNPILNTRLLPSMAANNTVITVQ